MLEILLPFVYGDVLLECWHNAGQYYGENWAGQRSGGKADFSKSHRNPPYRFHKLRSLKQYSLTLHEASRF